MTENDKHFLKEFVTGVTFGLVPVCLFMVFLLATGSEKSPPKGVELTKFEVIAKYKSCDVVRFAPPNGAEFAYLLDCGKGR